MSLNKYNDASLILVPCGKKAGKLYSQIPTDGDGDLTVTRASQRTEVNAAGNIQTISDNVPSLDFSLGSCPFLALDPSSTNLALQSADFGTTWTTSGGASVATNNASSPDGGTNADTLTLSAAAASRVDQIVSVSTLTEYTLSVYAKTASGTKDFRLGYNDGTSTTASSDLTATTTWQRFSFTFTTSVIHTNPRIRISNDTGGNAGDLIIWGAQLESDGYATSLIPTTTVAVARAADDLNLTGLITNSIVGATTGTLFIKGKLNVEAGNINLFQLWDGTSSNRIRISSDNVQAVTGGVSQLVSNVFTADADGYDDCLFAVRWNGTNVRCYVDGSAIGNANFTAGASMTQLQLLGRNTTSWIKELIFYNTALSDADMVTLTTP